MKCPHVPNTPPAIAALLHDARGYPRPAMLTHRDGTCDFTAVPSDMLTDLVAFAQGELDRRFTAQMDAVVVEVALAEQSATPPAEVDDSLALHDVVRSVEALGRAKGRITSKDHRMLAERLYGGAQQLAEELSAALYADVPAADPTVCYICAERPSVAPGEMCVECKASWEAHVAAEQRTGETVPAGVWDRVGDERFHDEGGF